MVFSTTLFLFGFLPLVLLMYYLCPLPVGNGLLLLMSLVFYGWDKPSNIWMMVAVITVNYLAGLFLGKTDKAEAGKRKIILILSLVATLAFLAYFKYATFVLETLRAVTGGNLPVLNVLLPIGISFYTFQALGYTIDVYTGQVQYHKNPLSFALFITMFPQLIAGPIVSYRDISTQLDHRPKDLEKFFKGILRFSVGLAKKLLIANQAGAFWDEISALPAASLGAGTAWLGAIAFTVQIYFDFSGYSDMAIGLGGMFGFDFPENFRYPYEADSITEFWRRWHITLSTWFRNYVYIPLGGNRKGLKRQIVNLFITWFLTGLWHGASWNFVLWGLYYFLLLTLEKSFLLKAMASWPKFVRHLYAMVLVIFGWAIFACDSLDLVKRVLPAMFGVNGIGAESHLVYYLVNFAGLLLLALIASTHFPKTLLQKVFPEQKPLGMVVRTVLCALLLLVCVSVMISDTYNPFLYFRF